jgi:hypothetical protein
VPWQLASTEGMDRRRFGPDGPNVPPKPPPTDPRDEVPVRSG